MKIVLSLFLLLGLIGCSSDQGSASKDSHTGPRKPQQDQTDNDQDTSGNPKRCVTNKVVEILLDKKTVISQSSKDSYQYVVWDHESLTKKNEIDRSKSYYRLSPTGEYVLRKITDNKFQLENLGKNSHYRESLNFSGNMQSIDFSLKSDFIIATTRSRKSIDQISVFDIFKKQKVFETTLDNIKYSQMIDDQHLYVASGSRSSNYLEIFDLTKENSKRIRLRYGELRWLGISRNMAFAKIDSRYYAYELNNEELLYTINIRAVYDFDYESDLAIISKEDFNQIHIFDIQTGYIKATHTRPENVYISTCRFTSDSSVLACRSKNNVDKIVLWNTETDVTKEVCF